jgi:hypothetical protein
MRQGYFVPRDRADFHGNRIGNSNVDDVHIVIVGRRQW